MEESKKKSLSLRHYKGGSKTFYDNVRAEYINSPHIENGNEILVKVKFIPYHPCDTLIIQEHIDSHPGIEGSGIVLEVGEDVTKFKEGDTVCMSAAKLYNCILPPTPVRSLWVSDVIMTEDHLIKTPSKLKHKYQQASQVIINPCTALATIRLLGVTSGDCIVLTAGKSNLGHYINQIARAEGITVINIDKSEVQGLVNNVCFDQTTYLDDLIANYKNRMTENSLPVETIFRINTLEALLENDSDVLFGPLKSMISELIGDRRVDGFIDLVGGYQSGAIISLMGSNKKVISVGNLHSSLALTASDYGYMIGSSITIEGFSINSPFGWQHIYDDVYKRDIYETVAQYIEEEIITIPEHRVEICFEEAVERADEIAKSGKVLFSPFKSKST